MEDQLKQNLTNILNEKNTKLLPENLKKGITCLGIEGTLDSQVKLFESQEAMQADPNASKDDLAIVYYSKIQNSNADTEFSVLNFPANVVLPSAVTDSKWCMLRNSDPDVWADGNIKLSNTSFRFRFYSESSDINIQYTSTDGINYTRTDTKGNPIDLQATLIVYMAEEWDDNFGYFIQTGSYDFDGLFEYSSVVDKDRAAWVHILADGQYEINNFDCVTKDEVYPVLQQIKEHFDLAYTRVNIVKINNEITYYTDYYYANGAYRTHSLNLNLNSNNQIYMKRSDSWSLSDQYYKIIPGETLQYIQMTNDEMTNMILEPGTAVTAIEIYDDDDDYDTGNGLPVQQLWYISNTVNAVLDISGKIMKYVMAPTQLTLKAANELLPGKVALGKNGPVTGDGSIYDNLDLNYIFSNFYNLSSVSSNSFYVTPQNVISTTIQDVGKIHYLKRDNQGDFFAGYYNKLNITSYFSNINPDIEYSINIFENINKTRIICSCGEYSHNKPATIFDKNTKEVLWTASGSRSCVIDCIGDEAYYVEFTVPLDGASYISNNSVLPNVTKIDMHKININTLEDTLVENIFTVDENDSRKYTAVFSYNPDRKILVFSLSYTTNNTYCYYIITYNINKEERFVIINKEEPNIYWDLNFGFSQNEMYLYIGTYPSTNNYRGTLYEINSSNVITKLVENASTGGVAKPGYDITSGNSGAIIRTSIFVTENYLYDFYARRKYNKTTLASSPILADIKDTSFVSLNSNNFCIRTYGSSNLCRYTNYEFNIDNENLEYNSTQTISFSNITYNVGNPSTNYLIYDDKMTYDTVDFQEAYVDMHLYASVYLNDIRFYKFIDNAQNPNDSDTLICNCIKNLNASIPCMFTYKEPPMSVEQYDQSLETSYEIKGGAPQSE